MEIIRIDESNIDAEHICCAIGNDKKNRDRADVKKRWMKDRFAEGLVFKRLDQRGKVFIEYMPVETVWKPVVGENFMHINCLWISGKYKKQGWAAKLLNECISDAKAAGMKGISVVTSKKVKPFLTDRKFFARHGFFTVDEAGSYFELMVLLFDDRAVFPRFCEQVRDIREKTQVDLQFVYSDQCPFMESFLAEMAGFAEEEGFSSERIKIESVEQAREIGSPFGTLGIYFRGEFLMHDLMPEKKFRELLKTLKA